MRNKNLFCKSIFIALTLAIAPIYCVFGKEDSSAHLLKLSSLGCPTAEKQKEAQKINELKIFGGRLYIGHGDAVVNTGPTDVIYYDLKKEMFVTEFTIDDEAIYKYQIIDGKLVIPGPDATEEWELGNIYVRGDSGWIKHRTLAHAIHVNDIASFQGGWFASTGSYFELGEKETFAFGAVMRSEDEGKEWKLVYATPCDENSVFRVGALIPYQNKLFAFVYAYAGMKKEEVPEKYRAYLGEPYQGEYLVFTPDVFGVQDAVVYDGKRWRFMNIIQKPNVCFAAPFVFKDKLVMSVLFGEYVDYLGLKEKLPKNATTALFAFDGKRAEEIPFEYDLIRDIVVKEDKLFLLILKNEKYFIAETADLKKWKYYMFPDGIATPKSIEHDGEFFYIGTEDGNIFKSTRREN